MTTLPSFSVRTMLTDLAATLRLVWRAEPVTGTLLVLLTLLQGLAPVATLYVGKLLLDTVAATLNGAYPTTAVALAEMSRWVLVQAVITIIFSVIIVIISALGEYLNTSLQRVIQESILDKAGRLELAQFENPETHDALKNALREAGSRPLSVLNQGLTFIQSMVTVVSIGAVLASLGGTIMALLVAAALPFAVVSYYFNRIGLGLTLRFTQSFRLQNYLASVLASDRLVKEIRLFQFTRHLIERWQEQYRRYQRELVHTIRKRTVANVATSVVSAVFVAAAALVIVRRVTDGTITVGDFAFLVGSVTQAQTQFTSLFTVCTKLHENLLYVRNLFRFLELESREPDSGELWSGPIDTIEFERVSFTYPLTNRRVLEEVSFRLRRDEVLALVGENGAGKSTLIKLLVGLYTPTSGRILINGQDASRFSSRSLQHEIAGIFQDFGQYHLTAAENIHAGQAYEERCLERAVDKAGVLGFIENLPQGLHNQLGRVFTGGVDLSGGQWQRLALARLYYKSASLWILDEPTAALDAVAEQEVLREVERGRSARITVFVSHRMSMARRADTILVLENGRIIELGNHEALMQLQGRYATLYTLQARNYVVPVGTVDVELKETPSRTPPHGGCKGGGDLSSCSLRSTICLDAFQILHSRHGTRPEGTNRTGRRHSCAACAAREDAPLLLAFSKEQG